MFKRSIQLTTVKTPRTPTPTETTEQQLAKVDKINNLVVKNSRHLAVGFVGVYAAVKVLNTASEIAINFAPKNH